MDFVRTDKCPSPLAPHLLNPRSKGDYSDTYFVTLTVDNDADRAVYVHAGDCGSAFVEAAKLYPDSHVQARVAQLIAEHPDRGPERKGGIKP